MASQNAAVLARIQRSGMGIIAPAAGLAALQAILSAAPLSSAAAAAVIANPFEWPRMLQAARPVPPVFAEHTPPPVATAAAAAAVPAKKQRTAATVVVQTGDMILAQVKGVVHSMLGPEVSPRTSIMFPANCALSALYAECL